MNFIKKLFDSQKKHFNEKGKLNFLKPLFDATETFFFIPGETTSKGPHIRDSIDLKRFMSFVILALMPAFIFGIYNAGYQSLAAAGAPITFFRSLGQGVYIVMPLVIISYGVGFSWEIVFASVRKHPISEGFLVTGLLYPMILPPSTPLWQAALGISFGVVIGKEIFGGTGRNFLNPALTGRAFLFFAYPAQMSGDAVWIKTGFLAKSTVDGISAATPLAISDLSGISQSIQGGFEKAGISFFKLCIGLYPGSIGETSAILILFGGIFLIATGIASWRIMLGGALGALATGYLLNLLATESSTAWFSLNPFYHLVMGGFALGICFMATDPVSAPGLDGARWIYGIAIGVLTVIIRVFNPAYPEGVMLSILFMNLFAPLLDHFAIEMRLKKRVPNV